MTQAVRDTSLNVFEKYKPFFETQEGIVFQYIYDHPNLTRNEISIETGIKMSAVCGRVKRLLNDNLINEGVQRKDYYSKNTSYTLHIPNNLDWNLIDIRKNINKQQKTLKLEYKKVCAIFPILEQWRKNNTQNIINMGEEKPENIIEVLKSIKAMRGIYEKYN